MLQPDVSPGGAAPTFSAFFDSSPLEGVCDEVYGNAGKSMGSLDVIYSPLRWSHNKQSCARKRKGVQPLCYYEVGSHPESGPWLSMERVLSGRWGASPLTCNRPSLSTQSGVANGWSASSSCRASADLIVAPSLYATCSRATLDEEAGFRSHVARILQQGDTQRHQNYWNALRRRLEATASPRALLLVHSIGFDSCDTPYHRAAFEALAAQPPSFVRRVVLTGLEDPFQHWEAQCQARSFQGKAARPTIIVTPPAILTTNVLRSHDEFERRPFALLFSGDCDENAARKLVREHILKLGGRCATPAYESLGEHGEGSSGGESSFKTCVLCTRGRETACNLAFQKHVLGERERLAGQTWVRKTSRPMSNTLSLVSRSTFCIEPMSDTLIRTHAYAAILGGCIPVLFDGYACAGDEPTAWAWRQLRRPADLPSKSYGIAHEGLFAAGWCYSRADGDAPAAAGSVGSTASPPRNPAANYSRFAIVLSRKESEAFQEGKRPHLLASLAARADARDAGVRALQAGLSEAAPLMRYAPPRDPQEFGTTVEDVVRDGDDAAASSPPGVTGPDAFDALVATLAKVISDARRREVETEDTAR